MNEDMDKAPGSAPLRHRLSGRAEQEHQGVEQSAAAAGREFGSVEELLREDARGVSPPERVAQRLQASVREAPLRRPWWRRWRFWG
ncbi:MAG TPA: hypothetical protein P5555_19055 [Candidatus Paceibacterota bacterium]|nr:hypothetical protein [Verrucomicrobiota bacterium]HRZ47284.1 hypothetical protein [Candidatus Paceibacterota bacterium]HRZ94386.1 hypothetical protein [Candidatus Paceibacterota bacterium]